MAGTVKPGRSFRIDGRADRLRLQLVATELGQLIGDRIRARRKELGLTQKQVAARMKSDAVDAQRVSDWERGYNKPSERYLLELVDALEVADAGYFMVVETETPNVVQMLNGSSQLDRIEKDVKEIRSGLDRLTSLLDTRAEEAMEQLLEAQAAAAGAQERTPDDSREADTGETTP